MAAPSRRRTPHRISCEFIPFADYSGGRYSIWGNNIACAAWLREAWAKIYKK